MPQLCYDVAYFILPHYAFHDVAKVADLCLNTPSAAGPFFYVMACVSRKVEPVIDDGKRFRWHHGQFNADDEFFVLEYPSPSPIEMSDIEMKEIVGGQPPFVLAPHFSAIIRGPSESQSKYFILGQAPFGGGTTLRRITADGVNSNLGPGPEPQLTAFLDAIRRTEERRGDSLAS
ncbi:MAG TPA: hypothetical protein VN699_15635 [Pirellulales bacterium]|nr:hypothetical protein [Pirellulales bacterium]